MAKCTEQKTENYCSMLASRFIIIIFFFNTIALGMHAVVIYAWPGKPNRLPTKPSLLGLTNNGPAAALVHPIQHAKCDVSKRSIAAVQGRR